MNERLKELVDKTNDLMDKNYHFWWEAQSFYQSIWQEKFAEILIRECGQILVDNTPVLDLTEDWNKGYDRAMNDCIHHIYEHFGVES